MLAAVQDTWITPELFPLGELLTSAGAESKLFELQLNPYLFISRHAAGEWGDVPHQLRWNNRLALRRQLPLHSIYRLPDGDELWIVTLGDRSRTILILPDEA